MATALVSKESSDTGPMAPESLKMPQDSPSAAHKPSHNSQLACPEQAPEAAAAAAASGTSSASAEAAVADTGTGSAPESVTRRRMESERVSWKSSLLLLVVLVAYYAPMLAFTGYRLNFGKLRPKSAAEAGVAGFSEERAFAHVAKLAGEIGFRTEGTKGLVVAREYLVQTIMDIKSRASSRLRVDVDVSDAYCGSFNLVFLKKAMTLGYQDLTNVLVRVSAADAYVDAIPSVLVNGHYDSSVASQGAADCASCVATMLETMRQIVEGDLVPPSPIVFLFNGGEEIFLKASHGFLTQHNWSASVGAFVNIEASGTKLPDLLVQSGAPWVQRVYGETVPHPMGSVIAQDIFPHIPGDTDFRILAQDFDDVPGLDIMFTLNGYAYHTLLDSPENLQPGAMQVRGENLLPLLFGLGSAPELKTREERRAARWSRPEANIYRQGNVSSGESWVGLKGSGRDLDSLSLLPAPEPGQPIFFDLFWEGMVGYSHSTALALLSGLLGMLALSPALATRESSGCNGLMARADQLVVGCLSYLGSWILAILLPALLAAVRVWASGSSMNWFATPMMAYASFVPMGLLGVLIPHTLREGLVQTDTTPHAREKVEWSSHWGGVIGCNALFCLAITAMGFGGGYLFVWWALLLLPSLHIFRRLQALLGKHSPLCVLAYLLPAAAPSVYAVGLLQLLTQFLIEKMGASGTHPLPLGLFVPDLVIAVAVGLSTALIFTPFAGALARLVCHADCLRVLLYVSLLASAQMCSTFPYSGMAPKRLLLSHTYTTQGRDHMLAAHTVMATADANDMSFVFRHAPNFTDAVLQTSPDCRESAARGAKGLMPNGLPSCVGPAPPGSLLSQYPVSDLLDRPAAVTTPVWQPQAGSGVAFPELRVLEEEWDMGDEGMPWEVKRRVHVEMDSGSLKEVWSAVLNVTGPVVGWSFADGKLPAPEVSSTGGPPSYILHLGGGGGSIHWRFWLEASSGEKLRVELGVMDHWLEPEMEELARAAPPWIALYPMTAFRSTYHL